MSAEKVASIAPLSHCQDVIVENHDEGPKSPPPRVEPFKLDADQSTPVTTSSAVFAINNLTSTEDDPKLATRQVFDLLEKQLSAAGATLRDLVSVHLTLASMADYAAVNAEYVRRIGGVNPPVRVCVEGPVAAKLSMSVVVAARTVAAGKERHTMHVQGISHWAPANIGECTNF